jgi:hypothetical protein
MVEVEVAPVTAAGIARVAQAAAGPDKFDTVAAAEIKRAAEAFAAAVVSEEAVVWTNPIYVLDTDSDSGAPRNFSKDLGSHDLNLGSQDGLLPLDLSFLTAAGGDEHDVNLEKVRKMRITQNRKAMRKRLHSDAVTQRDAARDYYEESMRVLQLAAVAESNRKTDEGDIPLAMVSCLNISFSKLCRE